jgi:hypothetical protein
MSAFETTIAILLKEALSITDMYHFRKNSSSAMGPMMEKENICRIRVARV